MQPYASIRRRGHVCKHGERDRETLVQRALLFESTRFDRHIDVADRRLLVSEYMVFQEASQRGRRHRESPRVDSQRERMLVVEGWRAVWRLADQRALQPVYLEDHSRRDMQMHVAERRVDRLGPAC